MRCPRCNIGFDDDECGNCAYCTNPSNWAEYVVGFAFNVSRNYVVLIRKARPEWQAGKLNGIGGHVETGESHLIAMVREFYEETGVDTEPNRWERYARLTGLHSGVDFFRFFDSSISAVRTTTDEPVDIYWVTDVLRDDDVLPNLKFLIPMALEPKIKFVTLRYNV